MDEDFVDDEDEGPGLMKKRKLLEMYDKDNKEHLDPLEDQSEDEGEEEPEFDDVDISQDSEEYVCVCLCF